MFLFKRTKERDKERNENENKLWFFLSDAFNSFIFLFWKENKTKKNKENQEMVK